MGFYQPRHVITMAGTRRSSASFLFPVAMLSLQISSRYGLVLLFVYLRGTNPNRPFVKTWCGLDGAGVHSDATFCWLLWRMRNPSRGVWLSGDYSLDHLNHGLKNPNPIANSLYRHTIQNLLDVGISDSHIEV